MRLRNSVCIALSLAAAPAVFAQIDTSAWPQVRVQVMAVDPDGNAIAGVPQDVLQVRGTGKPRPVSGLALSTEPQSVCVLVDASNADQISLERAKAHKMLARFAPEDELCVAVFADEMTILQAFTADRRQATQAVDAIHPEGGTHLRDALLQLADYMRQTAHNRSRAIVLFSDGDDHGSTAKMAQLKLALEAPGSPVVHMLCLPQAFGSARRKQGDPRENTAFAITELGGGMTYFPHTMGDMNSITEALPEAMRLRYDVTFLADNPARDGHPERLEIAIVDKAHPGTKIHIRTPDGFYAPTQ